MWINAFPRISGGAAVVVGSIVLVGWMFEIPLLKSLHPSMVSMKANAALAFMLAGTCMLLLHSSAQSMKLRRVSQALALFVILIGLLTSIEYTFGWNAGIDQLLFKDLPGAAGALHGGRMPFSAAVSFVCVGIAFFVLEARSRRGIVFSQILATIVGVLGLIGLLGYIPNLPEFLGYAVHTRMAAHGAMTFILLSIGVLSLNPDDGIIGEIIVDGFGGFMARRLLPAAVGIPILIGWITTEGERNGLYGNQFGDVIAAAAYIAIALVLTWRTARSLNKLDAKRKRMEKEQIESEKYFKELFDDAPVAYHELDLEGRISRVNQTELRSLGYRLEEMLGHFVWEFLDDQEASRQSVLAKLAGTKPPAKGVERVYRRKDMTTIDVVSEDTILRDADGRITGIRTTLQDVTELKLAQEQMRRSEERWRAVVRTATDAIVTVGEEGAILSWNEAAERIFGYSSDVALGMQLNLIIPEGYRDAHRIGMHRLLETGKPRVIGKTVELVGLRSDRSEFPIELSLAMVKVDDSVMFTGIIRDVSGRKKAEREIRLLAQTLSSTKDCVSVTDLDDNIIFVNDAFLHTYGYTREELVGHPVVIVRSGKTSPEIGSKILKETLAGGWYGEIFNRRKDGTDFPIELWTSVVKDESGKVIATVGVARDITAHKRAEQERESIIKELKTTLENVRTLDGLVPICAHCKKIRDDKGYWNQLEKYIVDHTDAKLTHGLCPECAELYFPGLAAKTSPGGSPSR